MSYGLSQTFTDWGTGNGLSQTFTVFRRVTRLLSALAVVVMLWGCGGAKQDNSPEFQASLAARQSYEALYVEGNAEAFLMRRLQYNEMPEEFRQQLVEVYSSHRRQVERQHQGVQAVDVVRAEEDTTLNCMQVFLSLTYGDGRREEVMVPMVLDAEGRWRMQ